MLLLELLLGALALSGAGLLVWLVYAWLGGDGIPTIKVELSDVLLKETPKVEDNYIYQVPRKGKPPTDRVQCYNPSTLQYLGFAPALRPEQVKEHVRRARVAQTEWAKSSFRQRRLLLQVLLKYIVTHQDLICRVSARDTGKVMVDAVLGDILTTCEKIRWLVKEGERWLTPEYRSVGATMMHKTARVEFQPLGVLGAIVPWNYPFHNMFGPIVAALFSGNAIVIKVSEYASWSAMVYSKIMDEALKAVGAPLDTVQVITGYAETGQALVSAGVDKLTFVGSTAVGRKVMEGAASTLTPLVLELGGKDPFIICDDADLSQVVPIALRAAFQSSGQNCVGAERFYVHEKIYDKFVGEIVRLVSSMCMGDPMEEGRVDVGAVCLPLHVENLQAFVDDAVGQGARVAAQAKVSQQLESFGGGQFFPPTVLVNMNHNMRIMREEVFGPIMPIMPFANDDEAVALANDSEFGLGSAVFSGSVKRANAICSRLRCGMTSINDFAATYMCQSLPFGGIKNSGFDRFAGIEGLRGCCLAKAIVQDRFAFIKTRIPPLIQYPVSEVGYQFMESLVRFLFSTSLRGKVGGLMDLLTCLVAPRAVPRGEAYGPRVDRSLSWTRSQKSAVVPAAPSEEAVADARRKGS